MLWNSNRMAARAMNSSTEEFYYLPAGVLDSSHATDSIIACGWVLDKAIDAEKVKLAWYKLVTHWPILNSRLVYDPKVRYNTQSTITISTLNPSRSLNGCTVFPIHQRSKAVLHHSLFLNLYTITTTTRSLWTLSDAQSRRTLTISSSHMALNLSRIFYSTTVP